MQFLLAWQRFRKLYRTDGLPQSKIRTAFKDGNGSRVVGFHVDMHPIR